MLNHRQHTRTIQKALGVVLTTVLVAPGVAAASVGTGVGAAPLELARPAHAGRSYTFHWLYVKDTGTVASSYLVKVQRLSPGSAKVVPASWIEFAPHAFRLRPQEIKRVVVTVNVPFSASGGQYMTDLVATTYVPRRAGATALGAAAADKLTFSIPSSSAFPWIIVAVVGGVALLVAVGYGLRRSGLRLRVDRAPSAA